MNKFISHWLNPKQKAVNRWNANYFYVTSIVFILVIILTHLFANVEEFLTQQGNPTLLHMLLLSFYHNGGFIHIFGNIECFVIVSLFLERHYGSLRYLGVIIGAILLSPLLDFALTRYPAGYFGESLVNYFLFGLFFVVVIFNYRDYILRKWQNVFVAIITVCIILLSSFDINVHFSFLTTFFTQNHGSAFVLGILSGTFSYLASGFKRKKPKKQLQKTT